MAVFFLCSEVKNMVRDTGMTCEDQVLCLEHQWKAIGLFMTVRDPKQELTVRQLFTKKDKDKLNMAHRGC
jgi:hypothetical protein